MLAASCKMCSVHVFGFFCSGFMTFSSGRHIFGGSNVTHSGLQRNGLWKPLVCC